MEGAFTRPIYRCVFDLRFRDASTLGMMNFDTQRRKTQHNDACHICIKNNDSHFNDIQQNDIYGRPASY
jgi:hypothetical protein